MTGEFLSVKTVSGRRKPITKISDLDEIMDPRSATFLPAATTPILNILVEEFTPPGTSISSKARNH